jgi:exosome complex exonuclease RRP6
MYCSLCICSFPHPYQHEIQNIEYPSFLFETKPEIQPLPLGRTPLTYVDTLEKLELLAALLDQQTEIAVDLEVEIKCSFVKLTLDSRPMTIDPFWGWFA